jgi:hypothetical protein
VETLGFPVIQSIVLSVLSILSISSSYLYYTVMPPKSSSRGLVREQVNAGK